MPQVGILGENRLKIDFFLEATADPVCGVKITQKSVKTRFSNFRSCIRAQLDLLQNHKYTGYDSENWSKIEN